VLLMVAARHLPIGQRTEPDFAQALGAHGLAPLRRGRVRTLQVNVGKLCNMACHHCHVDAGPKRTEIMPQDVALRVMEVLAKNPEIELLDLTGGAPELNPNFRTLVTEARRLGRRVIDRCNLSVLFEPGMFDLPEFLARHEVTIVASLPCYQQKNVDQQRGRGAFDKSIEALLALNAIGYGQPDSPLTLDLVYNAVGAFLPPMQDTLEARYKAELARAFDIRFHRLLTITNMPIKRFAQFLEREGRYEAYMSLLVNHFNPRTCDGLMCRSLVSVGWDGTLYDCDFNQMLELPLGAAREEAIHTISDVNDLGLLEGRPVAVASHCFGCTAGSGSSCSGAIS